jgi:hypothetical protein
MLLCDEVQPSFFLDHVAIGFMIDGLLITLLRHKADVHNRLGERRPLCAMFHREDKVIAGACK